VAQSGIFSHFSGATVMNIQTLGVSNSSGDIFRNCEDDSFVTIAFSLISRSCGGFQVNVVLYGWRCFSFDYSQWEKGNGDAGVRDF
jgi:hypothetical protein